jgi:hypothetical protein
MNTLDNNYWSNRYQTKDIAWDMGNASGPLAHIIDEFSDKNLRILIPGCGNAYEAKYLWDKGFHHVCILDWAKEPLDAFASLVPEFPKNQLFHEDFFAHEGCYNIILEQTFFCALDPQTRQPYVIKMHELLAAEGHLMGVLFNKDFEKEGPPFGGSKEEYLPIFEPYFTICKMETAIYSIPPRAGTELYIDLEKRDVTTS